MSRLTAIVAALAVLAACGDDSGAVDASEPPATDASADAPPLDCADVTFATGDLIAAGASDDLYGVGPGAWLAHAEDQAAPGAILYLEVYRDLFEGDAVEVDGFRNWLSECEACVFLGTGCASYDIPIGETGTPAAPTHCATLYMLDRGAVQLSAFDTDAGAGSLAGDVTPLDGQMAVRFVEVYREGDPSSPTGYGMMVPGGQCLELGSLQFSGSWAPPPVDAGAIDAVPADAGTADAGTADGGV